MRLSPQDIREAEPDLVVLLQDAVVGGAGLGFLPPLSAEEARAYWRGVAADVVAKRRVVLALRESGGRVVASAQLDLCMRPNGLHRAECQKVMVLASHRRRGLGSAIMRELEEVARAEGRSLLHLDTWAHHDARRLYEAAGWSHAGDIPRFAREADGSLGATSLYYKILDGA